MLTEMIIDQFIEEYQRSRIIIPTTVKAMCRHVMEYERLINKSLTDFSKDDIIVFYKSLEAVSVTSLMNVNLVIKHLLNWILFTNGVIKTNICNAITKDELKECVVKRTLISRKQLDELQEQLLNKVDVAILECLWLGMGSRWNTEITYLKPEQVSKTDMKVYFRNGKVIDIDQSQYNILYEAFDETKIISYNPTSMKVSNVNGRSIYKTRFNSIHDNDDKNSENDIERRFRFLQRRIKIMSDYLDVKLTPSLIQTSGFVHFIYNGMKHTGLSYRDFLHTEQCRMLARQYDILSKLYIQVIHEKVGTYFEQ